MLAIARALIAQPAAAAARRADGGARADHRAGADGARSATWWRRAAWRWSSSSSTRGSRWGSRAQAIVLERGRVVHASSSLALLADTHAGRTGCSRCRREAAAGLMPQAAAITGISSMATRALLAELGRAYEIRSGYDVAIESVGGVDAAARVQRRRAVRRRRAGSRRDRQAALGGASRRGQRGRSGALGRRDRGARRRRAAGDRQRGRAPARGAGGAHHRRLDRPERRRAEAALRALGHRRRDSRPRGHAAAGHSRRQAGRARRGGARLPAAVGADSPRRHRRARTDAAADPDRHDVLWRPSARARSSPTRRSALLAFMASPAAADAKRRQGMDPP